MMGDSNQPKLSPFVRINRIPTPDYPRNDRHQNILPRQINFIKFRDNHTSFIHRPQIGIKPPNYSQFNEHSLRSLKNDAGDCGNENTNQNPSKLAQIKRNEKRQNEDLNNQSCRKMKKYKMSGSDGMAFFNSNSQGRIQEKRKRGRPKKIKPNEKSTKFKDIESKSKSIYSYISDDEVIPTKKYRSLVEEIKTRDVPESSCKSNENENHTRTGIHQNLAKNPSKSKSYSAQSLSKNPPNIGDNSPEISAEMIFNQTDLQNPSKIKITLLRVENPSNSSSKIGTNFTEIQTNLKISESSSNFIYKVVENPQKNSENESNSSRENRANLSFQTGPTLPKISELLKIFKNPSNINQTVVENALKNPKTGENSSKFYTTAASLANDSSKIGEHVSNLGLQTVLNTPKSDPIIVEKSSKFTSTLENLNKTTHKPSLNSSENSKIVKNSTKNIPEIVKNTAKSHSTVENFVKSNSQNGQNESNLGLKTAVVILTRIDPKIVENKLKLKKLVNSSEKDQKNAENISEDFFENPPKLIAEDLENSPDLNREIFDNPPTLIPMIAQNPRVSIRKFIEKTYKNLETDSAKIIPNNNPKLPKFLSVNPENTLSNDNDNDNDNEVSTTRIKNISKSSFSYQQSFKPALSMPEKSRQEIKNPGYIEVIELSGSDTNSDSESDSSDDEQSYQVSNLGSFLLQDKKFTDIELSVGDQIFKVHRAVLASQSPYFSSFEEDNGYNSTEVWSFPDAKPEIFKLIIDFIYKGEIPAFNKEILIDILELADKFKIKKLIKICKTRLVKVENFEPQFGIKLLEIGTKYPESDFLDAILQLIKPIYKDIKKLPIWKDMVDNPKFFKVLQKLVLILDN